MSPNRIYREAPLVSKPDARWTFQPLVPLLGLLSFQLTGCTVVKGIFKAGVWVGVLGVCAVLALLVYGASRLGRRS